ncbi:MAG: transglycosylase SLT domain-containing protein [Campylobacterota bacterium]|nr:transglycosylase SLT domain-containing protein [Campylobacterota bacterium]
MKSIKKIVWLTLLLSSYTFALSITDKYPSYAYVFSEFDVDESYIYDETFETFVLDNEKGMKRFYKSSIKRGELYLPFMMSRLMDDGLSDLFIYLSMVESGFSPTVVSPKKAVGLWQFMPATAKHYELSVYQSYDERCDPVSSTNAAIRYLNKLHRQFGKWYLAAMAFNCGEGRLAKAIKKAGSDDLSTLVDEEKKYLPLETREYIRKILLASMIGESTIMDFSSNYHLTKNSIMQVEVLEGTKLSDLAKMMEMKSSELLNLNEQYKNGFVPKKRGSYKVHIPEEKMMLFYLRYETEEKISEKKEKKKPLKPYLLSYIVSLGDTLEEIAKKYKSSVNDIVLANQLKDDYLSVDQLLIIPVAQEIFEKALKE